MPRSASFVAYIAISADVRSMRMRITLLVNAGAARASARSSRRFHDECTAHGRSIDPRDARSRKVLRDTRRRQLGIRSLAAGLDVLDTARRGAHGQDQGQDSSGRPSRKRRRHRTKAKAVAKKRRRRPRRRRVARRRSRRSRPHPRVPHAAMRHRWSQVGSTPAKHRPRHSRRGRRVLKLVAKKDGKELGSV